METLLGIYVLALFYIFIYGSFGIYGLNSSGNSCTSKPNLNWNSSHIHVVFIGDSLTRYQFVATAFRLYFQEVIPKYVVNEKVHRSWLDYFENTTLIFEGSMKCDCFRYQDYRKIGNSFSFSRENRFFSFEIKCQNDITIKVMLTYIQFFGDQNSLHGRVLPSHIEHARPGKKMHKSRWRFHQLSNAIEGFVGQLANRPSHIVLNAGLWPHKKVMATLKTALIAANDISSNVYWKETSPRKTYALKQAALHNFTFNDPTDIDILARHYCEREKLCIYVEFPQDLPSELLSPERIPEYFDSRHFLSPELYIVWSKLLFERMHLSSLIKVL